MRGGVLPPSLLLAALAAALSFAPRNARGWAMAFAAGVAATVTAAAFSIPLDPAWREAIFLGCWTGTIAAAAAVHLPGGVRPGLALGLALNTGLWCGAVVAVAGQPKDLAEAAPWILLCIPGAWLTSTRRSIVVKVAASWLIAIAMLVAVLPLIPTPGYMPDHME